MNYPDGAAASVDFAPLEKIANAVLYEGYLLYPYRKSSVKNQQRWHFGTIGPPGGAERTMMQTQCLVEGNTETRIDVKVRFLQGEVEREIMLYGLRLRGPEEQRSFCLGCLDGVIEVESSLLSDRISQFCVHISNRSTSQLSDASMLSTHTLLGVKEGAFISLLDPPEECRPFAAGCVNTGTWPVLAGREGERTLMLSSPIILYDYPQIAPESSGDFFDGTEIDEILTLRVLTLSDEERQEVRDGDDRARDILDRSEALPPEAFAKMHGAIRSLRASTLQFREGDRVRLHPRKKADIFDIALNGKFAIVESVERDFEGNIHLAVTVEDDPGRDFGVARQIGHRFFFGPEEVELS